MENINMVINKSVVFFFFIGLSINAQKVSNVSFKQEQNKIIITYKLETIIPCKVSLYVSKDGGKIWQGPLMKVEGDIGNQISSPINSIIWNVLNEFNEFRGNNIKFQVRAIHENIETILIGSQGWTTKNLNVSKYRNGDIIPEVKDPEIWAKLTTGAWCYYDNDPENGKIYGKLYNWYAVNDPRGLAPEGYHIPSGHEWKVLYDFVIIEKIGVGEKKELWKKYNYELGDKMEIRFKGLPAGARIIDKNVSAYFTSIGFDGVWWSSSGGITDYELYNAVNYYFLGNAKDYNFDMQSGFSVRCIKD